MKEEMGFAAELTNLQTDGGWFVGLTDECGSYGDMGRTRGGQMEEGKYVNAELVWGYNC